MSACPPECSGNVRSPWKEERKRSGEEAGGRERREEEGERAGRHSERKAPAGLSVLVSCQVLICANLKGSAIKPGSMGKACAPYDVQVGGLSQPSVRRAKPTSRCARAGAAGGWPGCAHIHTPPCPSPPDCGRGGQRPASGRRGERGCARQTRAALLLLSLLFGEWQEGPFHSDCSVRGVVPHALQTPVPLTHNTCVRGRLKPLLIQCRYR